MEQKKQVTKAQLQKRIDNALIFIPKDKDTKDIFFSDRGLRLQVTSEYAIISTGYHSHVFDAYNAGGTYSRPYLFVSQIVDLAFEVNCVDEDNKGRKSYSYDKLLSALKAEETRVYEYLIAHYVSMWLLNIFTPLYQIGEREVEAFLTYFTYVANIAKNSILLSEHTEDITNKAFIEEFTSKIKEYTSDVEERVIFKKKTDEEILRESAEAAGEIERAEQLDKIEENVGNQDKERE